MQPQNVLEIFLHIHIGLKRLKTIKGHLTKVDAFSDLEVERKKVCVIGAGPAGIVSTRHFNKYHDVDTFEGRDNIGGIWNFSKISELTHPDLENDEYYKLYGHLNPSIYNKMTTNLPKYLMTLKDYPHPDDTPIMMQPDEYQKYLKAYIRDFKIAKLIQLNTLVTHVKQLRNCHPATLKNLSEDQLSRKFLVTTKHTLTREEKTETYDHIVCCNGRNSKKFIPDFGGKEDWDGQQLHMHEFREIDKESYEDKVVMVVGSSISACDYVFHLLMSPWKSNASKCYMTGTSMDYIKKTDDFRNLIDSGKLEFCDSNIKEFKKGKFFEYLL